MTIKRKNLTLICLFIIIAANPPIHAQRTKSSQSAGEQRSAEKGLKDNRYFFYFLNASVSNLGSDREKALYKEAIQRDLIAQQLYMKFLFHESFMEIRHAQKLLIECYRLVLRGNIKSSGSLLNGLAPEVIHKKNVRARHYLHLGYREREVATQFMIMADNFRESLYSMRLYKYVKAIKNVKQGKRYALLALIHSRSESPVAYHVLTFPEIQEGLSHYGGAQTGELVTVHHDNYYKTQKQPSFYDMVWDRPSLDEIPEYKDYLNIQ